MSINQEIAVLLHLGNIGAEKARWRTKDRRATNRKCPHFKAFCLANES
jgi:hypothetical protein